MTNDETTPPNIESWLKSNVYLENIQFWQRAWNMVKTPYTQMPDLSYLNLIPQELQKAGVQRVLDLGCGSGWLSIYLARQGFYVTGIDIANQAIHLAKQWAHKECLSIDFHEGDIANLPYANGSFDAVVANSIFEHLTAGLAKETLGQIRSILIPGGTFFGCFDKVGTGPGEYYALADGTHVYTDKGRQGMLLRYFSDQELSQLFCDWQTREMATLDSGSRIIWART